MDILQYDIYEVDISDGIKDDEVEDVVKAAVLSPNEMNELLKTIIIAPLCSSCALTPTTILIDEKTRIRLDQISAVPKRLVKRKISSLDKSQIPKVKDILNEMLVK